MQQSNVNWLNLNVYLVSQDLNEDDVMVLDSGDEVYVWVGRGSDDQEKEKAFAMAEVSLQYCYIFWCMTSIWKFALVCSYGTIIKDIKKNTSKFAWNLILPHCQIMNSIGFIYFFMKTNAR